MMGNIKGLFSGGVFFGLLTVAIGCGAAQKPNDLLGQWKVVYVDRGGMILSGPTFKGTQYTFRDNGLVFAENYNGDTLTSGYRQHGDTLTYMGIANPIQESYHVDTLTFEKLVLSAEIDGIPTKIRMYKRKK